MGATSRSLRRPAIVAVVAFVAIAALVLVSLGGGDGPPVIRLGAEGPAGAAPTAAREEAADMAIGMPYWADHEFVLGDGARFPAGEATAWRLDPPADLGAAAAELAERLGVEGEPAPSPYGDGGWQVGADDGSGPGLWVGPMGDWSFHDPTWLPEVRCAESEPIPVEPDGGIGDGAGVDGSLGGADQPIPVEPDGGIGDGAAGGETLVDPELNPEEGRVEPEPCEMPDPPAGIPTQDEARGAATDFFASLDLPATPRVTDVSADDWGAWVGATLPLDGRDSDLYLSVAFGPDAVVTSANGTLADVVEVGDYPTIDAEAAAARLADRQSWRGGGVETLDLPTDTGAAAPAEQGLADEPAPDTPVEGPAEDDVDDPPLADLPAEGPPEPADRDDAVSILPVPEPTGEPETVTVTLVAAEPITMLTWDADQTVWLLPAVRFTDDQGGVWHVLTVADEYLDQPEPGDEPTTEPGEPEPGEPSDGTEPGEGGGEPGSPGTEPGAPGEPGTEPGEPGTEPGEPDTSVADAVAEEVVGMAEEDAVALIEDRGLVARTVSRDGEGFAVTDDWRSDRVNLWVEGGLVVESDVY